MKKGMVTRWKRPLAAALGALFVFGAVCGAGSVLPEHVRDKLPEGVRETLLPVTSRAASGNNWLADRTSVLSTSAGGAGAQIVHYAGREWYVIAYDTTTCTLLQRDIIEYSRFDDSGNSNAYGSSTLNTAMNNIVSEPNNFSVGERGAIVKRTLIGNNVNYGQTGHNSDIINGDQVNDAELWPLSVAEASPLDVSILRTGSVWWLRSPGHNGESRGGCRRRRLRLRLRPQRVRCSSAFVPLFI